MKVKKESLVAKKDRKSDKKRSAQVNLGHVHGASSYLKTFFPLF
jgi:hypothetical protein